MIRLIMLTILIGIFVACKEETTIKKAPKIDGTWISKTKPTIEIYTRQDGIDIIGKARTKKGLFDINGSINCLKVIMHLHKHNDDSKQLIFTGALKNDTMKGTIKEGLMVREIEFVKRRMK